MCFAALDGNSADAGVINFQQAKQKFAVFLIFFPALMNPPFPNHASFVASTFRCPWSRPKFQSIFARNSGARRRSTEKKTESQPSVKFTIINPHVRGNYTTPFQSPNLRCRIEMEFDRNLNTIQQNFEKNIIVSG